MVVKMVIKLNENIKILGILHFLEILEQGGIKCVYP